jgi:enoyl-CoA hydratase/carnithine racemase
MRVYARVAFNFSIFIIREFITELANCDKILIGGLVGSVMGLGVAMLPYLNAVYACDKTSFCLPYVKLGQSYEGGLSLTLPSVSRNLVNLTLSGIV